MLGSIGRLHADYGDALRLHFFGPFYGYMFRHPDHFRHVLQENSANYTKFPSPGFVILKPVVGNGLLTSDGDFWLRQRRLAQPAFHRKRIAEFAHTMTAATAAMLARWEQQQQGGPFDMADAMHRLTLEIVGHTLFSIDLTGEAERIGHALDEIGTLTGELTVKPGSLYTLRIPFWPSTRRLHRQVAILDEVVYGMIAERRANPGDRGDLLSLFMAAQDADTGEMMDDRQLRDEVMTMVLAGHETTAVLLTWTFWLLTRHPDVLAQVQAELDSVLAGRTPTMEDVATLPYLTMVLQEVLRLYPPAFVIARSAKSADTIGGWHIPAGASLTLPIYYLHRHPDFWPDPERFDPLRFTPERIRERPRFAWLPFGGGPRQCIGNNFAMVEATLISAMILQRWHLATLPDHSVALDPQITLRPKGAVPMLRTPRPV
jgi:cytochrome P450